METHPINCHAAARNCHSAVNPRFIYATPAISQVKDDFIHLINFNVRVNVTIIVNITVGTYC